MWSLHRLWQKCFFVCYCLVGIVDDKPHWPLELGVWVAHPSGGSLKSRDTSFEFQSLHSSGRSWALGVSPSHPTPHTQYGAALGLGLRWESQPSLPIYCSYFLTHLMHRSHSASFWISFLGNCSVCSWAFGVFTGGGDSGASYVAILTQNPPHKSRPYILNFCQDHKDL